MDMNYKDRPDKSMNAPDFLRAEYAEQLERGELTLSKLRRLDSTLWAGLRNWANANDKWSELEGILPRGRREPGPAPDRDINFDIFALNPNDSKDKLILSALSRRKFNRESMRNRRKAKKLDI